MSEENAITKPNQSLGEAIVSEAQTNYEADLKKAVVNRVSRYMHVIGACKKKINRIKELMKFNQDKINALKSGDFDFDSETGEIKFHEDKLNVEWENVTN